MTGRLQEGVGEACLPPFEGVIFDMDGLLIDTESTYTHAWKRAALSVGVDLDSEFLHSLFGLHAGDVEIRLASMIGELFDRERFLAQAAHCWHEHIAAQGIALMPGADFMLLELMRAGIPYALATNSDTPFADLCLERSGLADRFPVKVCRDEVAAGKPEPDLFVEAASRMGVATERCLVLEDSPTGILAAARSGAIPILVSTRQVPEATRKLTRAVFPSLYEVAARLPTGTGAARGANGDERLDG